MYFVIFQLRGLRLPNIMRERDGSKMKRSLFRNSLLIALAAALVFTGCSTPDGQSSSTKEPRGFKTESKADTSSAPESEPEEEGLSEAELASLQADKFNAYISVNNFMRDRLVTVASGYFRRVMPQEEFQMQEYKTDYWCNSLGSSYYKLLDEADAYCEGEPAMPEVDAAYKKLSSNLRSLMEAFDAIYNYGELKTYKDDDYAGAMELHAQVWPLYMSYLELSTDFFAAVDTMSREQQMKDLELFKEYGYDAHYTFSLLIIKGQEIQEAIYMQEVSDENLLDLDLETLQPLYDEFVQLVNDALAITDEQIEAEGGFSISLFSSSVKDAKVSLTNLFDRVKKQRPLESYEINSAFPSSGTVSEFEEKMGDLVNRYNSLWR